MIGDVRDYELYYPEYAGRFIQKEPGDFVDLGDRKFAVVPAIWCDLKETLWGFDTKDRILFVADGFSATHHHVPGHCGLTAGEQPIPDPQMMRIINEFGAAMDPLRRCQCHVRSARRAAELFWSRASLRRPTVPSSTSQV